jgi:peptidoglycan/LPS O-acetylase OafA/YrhL
VAGFLTGRLRRAGLVGIGFVLLVAVNGHATANSTVASSRQGLLLLAVMFAGTVVHRAQHEQVQRRTAAAVLALVTVCVAVGGAVSLATVVAVVATFAVAFVLRCRPVPRILVRLGTISYSLYLLHVIVLMVAGRLVPGLAARPFEIRVLVAALFLAAALGVAELSYRFVELPGQALGRRLDALLATQRAVARTGRGENGMGCV